tara:strand:- start:261 stop:368 length:108 start_codon:yes stop_codon:yes gene_type:complete
MVEQVTELVQPMELDKVVDSQPQEIMVVLLVVLVG